jgi:hypothetical protein
MTKRIRTLTVSRLYREWGDFHRRRECTVPRAIITLAPISFESGELTSIARPKSAVLEPESLRTGSRTTRKCDLLYLATEFGVRMPRLIVTRLSLGAGVHKSLIVSASNLCTPFFAFYSRDLCTALVLCSLRHDCPIPCSRAALYPFSRGFCRERNDLGGLFLWYDIPVLPSLSARYDLTIMPKDDVLASVSEL